MMGLVRMPAVGMALTWWLGGLGIFGGVITLGQLVIFSGFLVFAMNRGYFTRDLKDGREVL